MSAEAFGLAADLRDSIEVANLRKAAHAARQSARNLASMGKHARASESLEAAAQYEKHAREIMERHAERRMTMTKRQYEPVSKVGRSPMHEAKLRYDIARTELLARADAHAAHPSDEDAADELTRACIEHREAFAAFMRISPKLSIAGGT